MAVKWFLISFSDINWCQKLSWFNLGMLLTTAKENDDTPVSLLVKYSIYTLLLVSFYEIFILLCWIYELTWRSINSWRETQKCSDDRQKAGKKEIDGSLAFRLRIVYFKSTVIFSIERICWDLSHAKPFSHVTEREIYLGNWTDSS